MSKTIIDKLWDSHVVVNEENKPDLLYIDLHLIHEVTSPQAFAGLREKNRTVRRPDLCFATMDHNIPTIDRFNIKDETSRLQVETLEKNCEEFGIQLEGLNSEQQGIVHVIGPELGLTLPGKTIVCGDSHTSTHGAFGALAFGIGTSEVEHVLATQTLWQNKPKQMKVNIEGDLGFGVTAKDVILWFIAKFGTNVGTGSIIEFSGSTVRGFSMEERMTLCNMSIEAGAKASVIAPDETTFEYIQGKRYAPENQDFKQSCERWSKLASDPEAKFDQVIEIDASEIEPMVTWGTTPSMCLPVSGVIPVKDPLSTNEEEQALQNALTYMGFNGNERIEEISVQHVFIGSCTNSRLSDLIEASKVVEGSKVHPDVRAIVVPGSQAVKREAETLGLHQIFLDAGFEWRESGCSMCLGMNDDIVPEGERCASTSNRNFAGRQGKGARTHLVSPIMAAAAALKGKFTDVRSVLPVKELEVNRYAGV
ncbi:isopropylmalate isomerase [Fictibacillus phosphorivorans]|uniref:3-isopropylmalate dehydratase large subunit n=1 Tax=Fictibacillus phosphorivorans TaxID=1221500 RepID=A0A163Q2T8_9BACL|nr:3-isopropylmalate dehydratase large subunit [Fictibacillus phosphorivorans]KZE64487.1 isopropylmalate isomerase [Fictibacillus phosphorivorans]